MYSVLEKNKFWAIMLLVLYTIWNFAAVVSSEGQESYDTYRYFSSVFDVQNPGVTTTAFFLAVGDSRLIIILLTLFSTIAFSLLVIAILYRLRSTWIRWPMVLIILMFSMTTPIWNYNTVLLTESLTVTSLILWITSIVVLAASIPTKTWLPLASLTVAAALAVVTRPQLLIIIIPTQFVLLIWVARRDSLRLPAFLSGLALLPFVGFGIFRINQLSEVSLYQFRYALNNLVDKGSSFRPYALETMPPCESVPLALNGPAPWNDVQALEASMMNICPDTWIWFNSDATRVPEWFLSDPIAALLDFQGSMARVVLSVMSEGRAMPSWLSDLFLNPFQPWLWMSFYAIIGITFAIIAKVRPKVTAWSITGILTVGLAVVAFMFVMWSSDGYDISRHIYPILPVIAIAFLVFPAVIPRSLAREEITFSGNPSNSVDR